MVHEMASSLVVGFSSVLIVDVVRGGRLYVVEGVRNVEGVRSVEGVRAVDEAEASLAECVV